MSILKNIISGGGNKRATIIKMIGQSNAEGVVLLSGLPSIYQGVRNFVSIWWENSFEKMEAGVNTVNEFHRGVDTPADSGEYQWASEQNASYLLQKRLNREVYVIKNALGSQSISTWDSPSGSMWLELKEYTENSIAELEAIGKIPDFRSTIFLQGEADVINNTLKATYKTKLRDLISNWRALSSYLTDTPFVMVKMRSGSVGVGGGETLLQELNDVYDELRDEDPTRIIVIDPDAIGASIADIGGDVHYNPQGYLIIGEAWYNTMM